MQIYFSGQQAKPMVEILQQVYNIVILNIFL